MTGIAIIAVWKITASIKTSINIRFKNYISLIFCLESPNDTIVVHVQFRRIFTVIMGWDLRLELGSIWHELLISIQNNIYC